MFQIIKLALQIFMKPYSLSDKASCRKFLENILTLIKPAAVASKTELDDKIITHIETILKNDVLFDYFYNLVCDQFESEFVLFEAPDESSLSQLCCNAAKESSESISVLTIVAIVTQIIELINALKK